jgi:hypothetical protein
MYLALLQAADIIFNMCIRTQIMPSRSKLVTTESYDKEKYLDMVLDSAEAVLSVFGFNRSLLGFDRKKTYHWWDEIYQQRERDIESAKIEL